MFYHFFPIKTVDFKTIISACPVLLGSHLAPFEDEIPEGEFPVSSDLDLEQMVLPSYINSYGDTEWSWYHWDGGRAPIVGGKITFVDNGDDTMTVVMDLVDDAGYKITGECTAEFDFYF